MEELLKIAKEKYPIGTVFKSVRFGDRATVLDTNFSVDNGGNIYSGNATIYYENEWAEIISKPEVKEETMTLFEEAKKRFPIGTKFVPAHINTVNNNRYCIIVEDGEFVENEEQQTIFQKLKDGSIWDKSGDPKYGNTDWNRCFYEKGKWARIIEEPETIIVEDLYNNITLVPGKARVIRTSGQIKEDSFFKTATESLCKMLEAKNKAYGESALKPLNIFAKHHNYGSRLDEKLARIKNSEELRKNDVADIIGGLLLICKDKGWSDFTDLID